MIKLIVLDVDGCLTDGSLTYDSNGIESKSFNVKDGLGISTWIRMGNDAAIITGKKSAMVKKRADELGIKHIFQGIKDKKTTFDNLIDSLLIKPYEVAVIGDDLNDYDMLCRAGRSFTPNNGVNAIKEIVDTVLSNNGGDGAAREMIDILVKENDQQEDFLGIWR